MNYVKPSVILSKNNKRGNVKKLNSCCKLSFVTYQKFLLPGEVGHVIEILVNKAMHYG